MSLVNAYKNWQQLCRPSFLRPLAVPARPLAVPTRELTGVDKTCSQVLENAALREHEHLYPSD
jgi:hypothetical protein